jgi:hypothetical protein
MKTLKTFYDDIVSIHAQFCQLQYDLMDLRTQAQTDWTKPWQYDWLFLALSAAQSENGKLADKLWALPEVNGK